MTKRTAHPVFFYAQDGSPGDNKLKLSHLSTWVFCQRVVSSQCPTAYPTLDDILFTCQPKNCILWDLGKLQQLETMYSTALSQDLLHTWTTHRKRKFLAQALRPPWILQGATTRKFLDKIYMFMYKDANMHTSIYIYLEPVCPLFWGVQPSKRRPKLQSKQGSFGFQVYYTYTLTR